MSWWNKEKESIVDKKKVDELQKAMNQIAKRAIEEAILKMNEKIKDVKTLNEEIEKLRNETKELTLKKNMDEREVKQLVKLKLEQAEIDYQKKELELKNTFADKQKKLMEEYQEKQVKFLEEARKEMKEMYNSILTRLPNLQATLELAAGQGRGKEKNNNGSSD